MTMEQPFSLSELDFTVKKIGHVFERSPNNQWRINNLANPDYHIIAYAIDGEVHYKFDDTHYHIKRESWFFPKGICTFRY